MILSARKNPVSPGALFMTRIEISDVVSLLGYIGYWQFFYLIYKLIICIYQVLQVHIYGLPPEAG